MKSSPFPGRRRKPETPAMEHRESPKEERAEMPEKRKRGRPRKVK